MSHTVFVAGASGATGRLVVQMLLEKGVNVKVVVRSKERMKNAIPSDSDTTRLAVTEASLLDMTDSELKEQVNDCDAVVSCLGHSQNLQGLYGHPRNLVTDATRRLTSLCDTDAKFILMAGESISNAGDDRRTLSERAVLSVVFFLAPPFQDNQNAANYLLQQGKNTQWCVIRPARLVDDPVSSFELYEKPQGSLFDGKQSTRANVAQCMVNLIHDPQQWEQWKYKMPVIRNAAEQTTPLGT